MPYVIDTMAGRPQTELKSKSFAIYEKTWLILKDLENKSAHAGKKKTMKELTHEAVKNYVNDKGGSNK